MKKPTVDGEVTIDSGLMSVQPICSVLYPTTDGAVLRAVRVRVRVVPVDVVDICATNALPAAAAAALSWRL